MPLDRFVLIIIVVIAAAAATVWIGTIIAASLQLPFGWLAMVPAALIGYVLWRVIADRVGNAEEDRYDDVER